MLANNRVIFPDDHFLGHGACVLLGHVEVAGARRGIQADLDGGRLRHVKLLQSGAQGRWPGARVSG